MDNEKLELLKGRLQDAFSDYYELAGGKEFRYHHHISVHSYAIELMSRDEITDNFDRDTVKIAALFHDIGRAEDIEDGRMSPFEGHEGHGKRGAEAVESYIGDVVDDETLAHVETIIRNHVNTPPESVEGKLVQDADLLFKFGVQDLWRGFHYASENNEDIEERLEYFKKEQLPKKEKEKEKLHYDISKDIAARRIEEMEETMKRFEKHLRGADIADFSE